MDEDATVGVCNFTFPRMPVQSRVNASRMCTSLISSRTHMPRGGAIFEVSRILDAKIAEKAGACAIVLSQSICFCNSRMIDPSLIAKFKAAVSIPIIARVRVGHVVEAETLQAVGVDFIDESEILGTADKENHINKGDFTCPFICGSTNLGEALERIKEGAAMIRTQGIESISGDIATTVQNVRSVMEDIKLLHNMSEEERLEFSGEIGVPSELAAQTGRMGRLPVVHFAAGGIVTPADAAFMMILGCDGVFVGPEMFDWPDPYKRARGIVEAVNRYNDPNAVVVAMSGLN
ncbi:hypothetical protein QN277_022564 [Acacia crassicarpa]|uniref:PdxS/SNZ N-terminal domain-containing protein n=1 Tax=Acacia crassicarpa TaxID=499986 RepID=A0AAE1KA15_9FABA|nr:hypothetical protein QN277_022564 [Acacia crassicarpa]